MQANSLISHAKKELNSWYTTQNKRHIPVLQNLWLWASHILGVIIELQYTIYKTKLIKCFNASLVLTQLTMMIAMTIPTF